MNLVIRLTDSSIKGNSIKVSKCALKYNLSSSNISQVTENQREAHIIRLTELQQILKFQPQRVCAVKARALIGKEWDPVMRWGCVGGLY